MDNKKIGELIAKLRKEKGFTQQELGDMVGVGSRAVSKWECGTTIPDISIINELSQILGITSDELLSGKIKNSKNSNNKPKKLTIKSIIITSLVLIPILLIITMSIYSKNKTYVYKLATTDYQNYSIDGYLTYKKGIITLNIRNFVFDNNQLVKLEIKDYQYDIQLNDETLLGYCQTKEDINAKITYKAKDIEEMLKINYNGSIKLTKTELMDADIYIILTIWDEQNTEYNYRIAIELYKIEKNK